MTDIDSPPQDDQQPWEACASCLSDDAAMLHEQNPEDEIADNMLKAETLLRDQGLLINILHDALEVVVRDWTEQFERTGHMAPGWCKQAKAAIAKAHGLSLIASLRRDQQPARTDE